MGQVLLNIEGSVARVVLSNPGRRNAISRAMWLELARIFDNLEHDNRLSCVILCGEEHHFASGADITEFPQVRHDLASVRHYHENVIAPTLHAIASCQHPIIAAIEGVCVGGGLELASCCDLRFCGQSSRFGVPINRLGFPMAPAELRQLIRVAGPSAALELLLEGRIIDASEALRMRLVTRVFADDAVMTEAMSSAQAIGSGAPLAVRLNKWLVRRLCEQEPQLSEVELDQAFSYAQTLDHREGITAFLEGRQPRFVGR